MSSMIPPENIKLKRAYVAASPSDGKRILVDRLWPRGISKEKADLTEWLKDIAPTTELRKWFGHIPAKWDEFQKEYRLELKAHTDDLDKLRELATKGLITLVFGARDTEHNSAVVLRDVLLNGL